MSRFAKRLLAAVFVGLATYACLVPAALAADVALSSEPTVTLPATRLEDDDLRMSFGGKWRTWWGTKASGETWMQSLAKGASARTYFEGTRVAWVSSPGPDRGRARVWVDGVAVATVDLYAARAGASRVVWASDPLTDTRHSVKIEVLGTKNPASSGTKVIVDAFEFSGSVDSGYRSGTRINNGNSKLARTGRWWTSERTAAFGGSAWRTSASGRTAIVRFKGTGVAWIGRKDRVSGKAEVLLDGKRVAVVSQYSDATAERRVAWAVSGLPYGEHTLVVRSLGKPSTGTGTRVDVDAFLVNGTVLQAYRPTPFKYPWSTYVVVDKSSFRLYWVKQGLLIKVYPVAHGKASTPTPSRVWRINSKYITDPNSVYGPRKMRLYRRVSTSTGYRYEYTRYLIHGTNEPWVIGTRASHGCIRMYNRDALELWPQVPLGTMVVTRD